MERAQGGTYQYALLGNYCLLSGMGDQLQVHFKAGAGAPTVFCTVPMTQYTEALRSVTEELVEAQLQAPNAYML